MWNLRNDCYFESGPLRSQWWGKLKSREYDGNRRHLVFTNGGGASYGQVLIGNVANINSSAPTTSSSGALFFLDRNWVHTAAQNVVISSAAFGKDSTHGDGIWYLPSAGLQFINGSFNSVHYCPLVADNFYSYNFTYDPKTDFSSVSGGNPFTTQSALVQWQRLVGRPHLLIERISDLLVGTAQQNRT